MGSPFFVNCRSNCYTSVERRVGGEGTSRRSPYQWPTVTQTLEHTMREHFGKHFGKHSATSWFGVTLLRQLSLQLLFLSRESKVGYETLLLTAVLWPPVPQTLENTMREHFREHSGTSWFGGGPLSCHWKCSARFHKTPSNNHLQK